MASDEASAVLRDLLVTTKDGDWGQESPTAGFLPYRVIRGTDFPAVRVGDVTAVPLRYLSESTAYRRTLKPDDILIETAGGSRDRPTGRSLLVTKTLLSSLALPATCASFARFLRVDPAKANPGYVYWYLQHLYASGEMDKHQVQHTGVARFQYTKFAETERVPFPPLPEQARHRPHPRHAGRQDRAEPADERDAGGDGAGALQVVVRGLRPRPRQGRRPRPRPAQAPRRPVPGFLRGVGAGRDPKRVERIPIYDIATYINGAAYAAFEPNDERRGLPIIKIAELKAGVTAQTKFSDVLMAEKYRITMGDILFSWSGNPDTSIDTFVWSHGPAWLNQHIFRVLPHRQHEHAFVLATLKTLGRSLPRSLATSRRPDLVM